MNTEYIEFMKIFIFWCVVVHLLGFGEYIPVFGSFIAARHIIYGICNIKMKS